MGAEGGREEEGDRQAGEELFCPHLQILRIMPFGGGSEQGNNNGEASCMQLGELREEERGKGRQVGSILTPFHENSSWQIQTDPVRNQPPLIQ